MNDERKFDDISEIDETAAAVWLSALSSVPDIQEEEVPDALKRRVMAAVRRERILEANGRKFPFYRLIGPLAAAVIVVAIVLPSLLTRGPSERAVQQAPAAVTAVRDQAADEARPAATALGGDTRIEAPPKEDAAPGSAGEAAPAMPFAAEAPAYEERNDMADADMADADMAEAEAAEAPKTAEMMRDERRFSLSDGSVLIVRRTGQLNEANLEPAATAEPSQGAGAVDGSGERRLDDDELKSIEALLSAADRKALAVMRREAAADGVLLVFFKSRD